MFNSKDGSKKYLKQIADKLAATTHQLDEAAKRLQLAELTYRQYLLRLRQLEEQMRKLADLLQSQKAPKQTPETNPAFCEPPKEPEPKRRKLRYADYIEFSNYAELRKFEKLGEITRDDVAGCDPDELMRKLLRDGPPRTP
ncbi:MAG: hypothetical protein ACOC8E_00505 [Planctomycetota bacterium]